MVMGRTSNKKRYQSSHERDSSRDFGLADALHDVKRRRLSVDAVENGLLDKDGRTSKSNGFNDNDGWQTVPSRSSKRRDRHEGHKRPSNHHRSYPELTFSRQITRPVSIEQLRDLALYVLADGTGPDWVAVNNARDVAKVVVLMIPGFDESILHRANELVDDLHKGEGSSRTQEQSEETLPTNITADDTIGQLTTVEEAALTSASDGSKTSKDLDQVFGRGWLLGETFPTKAPGDSKYNKVHSPLQAILMAPEVVDRTKSSQTSTRTFKPTATSITHYIHTSDELREAEYPIHPAAFSSATDATLEASRRESTEQSVSAGWVDSEVTESGPLIPPSSEAHPRDKLTQGLSVYAIDCEMVLTSDQKSSLARISVVSWPDGKTVLDKFVKPDLSIENYFTQYSGITAKVLEGVTTRLTDIQQELLKILTPSTILLGHSLESDLNAMKMTHPFIVDTSMLYPHPRGLPLRSSLKFLANKYLKREIQMGGASGHDSVEDAKAVLDLVKLKCEKGPKFGTPEANGEPIFKRLSRHKRRDGKPLTSAIVEYGSSPERGLGKDATYAIGCQNDEQIVAGMLRAIKGDTDGKEILAGGVDFIWGRLRALEFARGWVTNNNTNAPADNESSDAANDIDQNPPQNQIDAVTLTTLYHIAEIRNALPRTTLLIVYSGTSDVRPVLKLQAIQSQYRKEFKVKKWDELSVKWTDVEEQALRNAADKARAGWGWVGIV